MKNEERFKLDHGCPSATDYWRPDCWSEFHEIQFGGGWVEAIMGIGNWGDCILRPVKCWVFPYLHYPNNRFENISVVYVLLFNSVAYKLLLGIKISSVTVMRICRSVKELLSVLSIFIDDISQRNSIEQLKNFVIIFFRFGWNLVLDNSTKQVVSFVKIAESMLW